MNKKNMDENIPVNEEKDNSAEDINIESENEEKINETGEEERNEEISKKDENKLKKENRILKEELKNIASAADEIEDKYKRVCAEYDNYRKRTAKERETVYSEAYTDALRDILPVLDNLERALAFSSVSEQNDKLTEGVKMTVNQFIDLLKRMGVESVGKIGDKFDPNLHNAVMHEENEELNENEITEVFQKGYKIGDRVIRYAMVKTVN